MSDTSSFFSRFAGWMTTASSVIGTAVATPTLGAALAGQITWEQAAFPLLGAMLSIVMPERGTTNPVVHATSSITPVSQAADSVSRFVNAIGSAAGTLHTPAGQVAAMVLPDIATAIQAAAAEYNQARAKLAGLKSAAQAQADALVSAVHADEPNAPPPAPPPAPAGPASQIDATRQLSMMNAAMNTAVYVPVQQP